MTTTITTAAEMDALRRGECTEDMGSDPCGRTAVAARVDPVHGDVYPVCTRHARTPDLMVPLSTLLRPDAPAQPTPAPVDGDAAERAARVLWEDARQEYDYDWEPNADRFRDLARAALAAARAGEVDRCPSCGGLRGAHGLVHVRHENGGGSNRPCPVARAAGDSANSQPAPSDSQSGSSGDAPTSVVDREALALSLWDAGLVRPEHLAQAVVAHILDHPLLAARGDAAVPSVTEWGVRYPSIDQLRESESDARTAVSRSPFDTVLIRREVAEWREVTP